MRPGAAAAGSVRSAKSGFAPTRAERTELGCSVCSGGPLTARRLLGAWEVGVACVLPRLQVTLRSKTKMDISAFYANASQLVATKIPSAVVLTFNFHSIP